VILIVLALVAAWALGVFGPTSRSAPTASAPSRPPISTAAYRPSGNPCPL
jgi:hypothetical protein